ncbi:MAG: D-alanine--D-alanine ligase family protein, partial [Candidatus Aminicenantales bacterium]
MKPAPDIAIVFNAYEPRPTAPGERLSEESVADMAQQAHDAVRTIGIGATLVPLQRSLLNFLGRVRELNPDALINLCEGYYGRPQWESNVAGIFELLGLSFTGNAAKTLAFCQDKFKAKAVLNAFGLPTPKGRLVTSTDQKVEVPFPAIVKPNSEDASLGIYPGSVVHDQPALQERVTNIIDGYKQPALVEEFIEGREFNVAVLETDKLQALPVSEIDFSAMPETAPHICSYEAKWFEDHALYAATPAICPAPIDEPLREKLQQYALAAFQAMGCRDYARVDFRMGQDGRVAILEVN